MLANPYDEDRALFLTCVSRFDPGSVELRTCQMIGIEQYRKAMDISGA